MTQITAARPGLAAAKAAAGWDHALCVLRDPTVHIVWREAASACLGAIEPVRTAAKAVTNACHVTATSWRRG